jgi:hypothetical protein
MTNPAEVKLVSEIVAAYLRSDTKTQYSPEMGYIASLLVTYMPPARAFVTYRGIMRRLKVRQLYSDDGIAALRETWDRLLANRAPELQARFAELEIDSREIVIPWIQSAFLSVAFVPDLVLRIFDRFIERGIRVLVGAALLVLLSMRRRIQSAPKAKVLEMIADPAKDPVFASWKSVLARLRHPPFFILKKEYAKYAKKEGGSSKRKASKSKETRNTLAKDKKDKSTSENL